jgi:hypothetical protein
VCTRAEGHNNAQRQLEKRFLTYPAITFSAGTERDDREWLGGGEAAEEQAYRT